MKACKLFVSMTSSLFIAGCATANGSDPTNQISGKTNAWSDREHASSSLSARKPSSLEGTSIISCYKDSGGLDLILFSQDSTPVRSSYILSFDEQDSFKTRITANFLNNNDAYNPVHRKVDVATGDSGPSFLFVDEDTKTKFSFVSKGLPNQSGDVSTEVIIQLGGKSSEHPLNAKSGTYYCRNFLTTLFKKN